MIKKLKSIIWKVRFGGLKKSSVCLLHEECRNIMHKMVLHDIDYSILPAAQEVFYITPLILFFFIKNVIRHFLVKCHLKHLYPVYMMSCVEYIHPKIVITFIDNSSIFHAVSRHYKKAAFYAIQNGIKCRHDVTDSLPPAPHPGSVISMPHLVCFGQHDIDLHKKYGHCIDYYHPVGSLIGGYFKTEIEPGRAPIKYDLCLVSQWRRGIMNGDFFPEMKIAYEQLNEFVRRYVDERELKLCVATCRSNGDEQLEEQVYYRGLFGDAATVLRFDRLDFSTYRAMDKSRVTISVDSCAAWEAFGWGKKVFFCNFSADDALDFPEPGLWSLNRAGYEEFRQKLDYLLAIDEKEYLAIATEKMRRIMNYNFSLPAHKYIRNIIREEIKK